MRRVIAVVNAAAGSAGAGDASQVAQALREHGLDARVLAAEKGTELAVLARRAVEERPDAVVAAGGDGTVSAVAAQVVGSDIALGVLPLGTLNHFAKALRIPQDLAGAAAAIASGRVERVDVGEVNGRIFLNNSSLGLYPSLVRRREARQQQLGHGKWAAAALAAATLLRRHGMLSVRLLADGVELRRRTPLVFVGNNTYCMDGLRIGERERLDAGRLGLYVLHRSGRAGVLLLAARALLGRARASRRFDALAATAIDIESRRAHLPVANDGEVELMRTPLHYRSRPRALRVIAPRAD